MTSNIKTPFQVDLNPIQMVKGVSNLKGTQSVLRLLCLVELKKLAIKLVNDCKKLLMNANNAAKCTKVIEMVDFLRSNSRILDSIDKSDSSSSSGASAVKDLIKTITQIEAAAQKSTISSYKFSTPQIERLTQLREDAESSDSTAYKNDF